MTSSRVSFISKNCTIQSDEFTVSYKFWSLKHFLSREDFKSSNERVQTDKRQISNGLYRGPAKQYENYSSMTNEVHDTNLIVLVFLNFKK